MGKPRSSESVRTATFYVETPTPLIRIEDWDESVDQQPASFEPQVEETGTNFQRSVCDSEQTVKIHMEGPKAKQSRARFRRTLFPSEAIPHLITIYLQIQSQLPKSKFESDKCCFRLQLSSRRPHSRSETMS